jgi:hypothetical protein
MKLTASDIEEDVSWWMKEGDEKKTGVMRRDPDGDFDEAEADLRDLIEELNDH